MWFWGLWFVAPMHKLRIRGTCLACRRHGTNKQGDALDRLARLAYHVYSPATLSNSATRHTDLTVSKLETLTLDFF